MKITSAEKAQKPSEEEKILQKHKNGVLNKLWSSKHQFHCGHTLVIVWPDGRVLYSDGINQTPVDQVKWNRIREMFVGKKYGLFQDQG